MDVSALGEDLSDSFARPTAIIRTSWPKRLIDILSSLKQLIAQHLVGLRLSAQSELLGKVSNDGSGLHDLRVSVHEQRDLAEQQARLMCSFVRRIFERLAGSIHNEPRELSASANVKVNQSNRTGKRHLRSFTRRR